MILPLTLSLELETKPGTFVLRQGSGAVYLSGSLCSIVMFLCTIYCRCELFVTLRIGPFRVIVIIVMVVMIMMMIVVVTMGVEVAAAAATAAAVVVVVVVVVVSSS